MCLQLAPDRKDPKDPKKTIKGDNPEDIKSVSIQANAVFPPRGSGPNIAHQVKVEYFKKDAAYPYNLQMTMMSEKLYNIYYQEVMDIVGIAGTAGTGTLLVPILGLGLGVGAMFL